MKSSAYGVSFVLLCVAFILASCGLGGTEPEAEEAAPTVAIQVPTITLPTIEPADVADLSANLDVIATGSVEAAQDAELVFQINGTVDRILSKKVRRCRPRNCLLSWMFAASTRTCAMPRPPWSAPVPISLR
ncbi:MAG: hypothetical protein HC914_19670 [Chloroflexaceae bacterium]|nr:hypothetical protein [Chloroflexaceae bacterium]